MAFASGSRCDSFWSEMSGELDSKRSGELGGFRDFLGFLGFLGVFWPESGADPEEIGFDSWPSRDFREFWGVL